MVCMQHPYQHQDNFEKTINRKVYGFEFISDGVNTLWVFYNDGTVKWLQIKRVSVMDFDYDEGTLIALQFSGHIFNGSKKGVP